MVYYHLALRSQRIFPEYFELVWPGGLFDDGVCEPSRYHCGISEQAGKWGVALYQHLMSVEVAAIYRHHGLKSFARTLMGFSRQ